MFHLSGSVIQALSELLNTCSYCPLQLVTRSGKLHLLFYSCFYMAKGSPHISLFRLVNFIPVLMRKSDFNATGVCRISYLGYQLIFDYIFRVWFKLHKNDGSTQEIRNDV